MVSDVSLPANAFLHFSHAFDFDTDSFGFWDGGVVEYSTDGGLSWTDAGSLMDSNGYMGQLVITPPPPATGTSDNPLRGRSAFVGVSHGYISTRLNLQSLGGQTVRFRWRQGTDSFFDFIGWLVDDVQIYTCATAAITANSVSPSSGTGTSQTFTLRYADTAGATDLTTAWTWINATFATSAANSCLFNYTRASNTLALLNDAGTANLIGTLGSGGTLQNNQCTISLAGSAAVVSGNGLTLTVPVTFSPTYAGTKTIFMYAANGAGTNSAWQPRGTWTVPGGAPAVVTADSVTPNTGSGASQPFTFQYGDSAGATDLATVWTWINATFATSAANSCLFNYTRASNTLALLNDAGTANFIGTLGSGGTLQNSQCTISLAGSTVVVSGNALTLTVPVTFAPTYAGTKTIFMYAANGAGTNSAWQPRGTWTVPGSAPPVLTADSVTPNTGSGASQPFTFQYGDTAGGTDLATVWTWINATFATSAANSCLFNYTRASNTLALLNDAGTANLIGTLGSGGTLQNSQCAISLAGSAAVNGTTLTLTVAVTFTPAYTGTKTIFMYAANGAGTNSGWLTQGTWTVP